MKKIFLILTILSLFPFACSNPAKSYEEMEQRELAKNIRRDDLLLGLKLGMESKAFFTRCKELNGQRLLTNGTEGLSVKYEIPKGKMKFDAYCNFFPDFKNDKVYYLPLVFSYTGWMPGISEMTNVKLVADVKKYAESEYGTGFIPVKEHEGGKFWAKVDGNRRITISIRDESSVRMVIADLTVVKELEKEGKTIAW